MRDLWTSAAHPSATALKPRRPDHARSSIVLRRLVPGECREVGDFYLSYGESLAPVDPEWISRWRPWRNRIKSAHCPHYRIVRMEAITPIS